MTYKQLINSHLKFLLDSTKLKLFFLGVYFPLLIFIQLTITVVNHPNPLAFDTSILLVIHQTAQPLLDVLAARLTDFGIYWGVLPATLVLAFLLSFRQRWRQSTYLLTSMLGCYTISALLKLLVHRARPSLWELFYRLPYDYSFPSGHAISSMTFVVALLVLSWKSPYFWLVFVAGSLFVVMIAWTRLYLGLHFPSDILAGWMLSIAWALGVSFLIQPYLKES